MIIDWANVYGWQKSLKRKIDPKNTYHYLQQYPQIKEQHFYFGKDKHPKSQQFLNDIKKIGFIIHTKPVKYIKTQHHPPLFKRKCDFDLEISVDIMKNKNKFSSFIFFSGDGDFTYLYQELLKQKKQIIVVYSHGHLGKEIYQMKKGVFKISITKMGL